VTSTEAAHFFAFWSASAMFAASMEAPSYGASKLPFAIRHRPTLYVTKFASCVGSPFVIPGRRCYPRAGYVCDRFGIPRSRPRLVF
jgi:hypothetical protein